MAVVSGTITFNTPINTKILVQAFDKDMRSEQQLGEALLKGLFSVVEGYSIECSNCIKK